MPQGTDSVHVQSQVHLVTSHLPTVLGNRESLPVPATDLYFVVMEGGFIYPGPLNIERLKFALGKTLQYYPHVAGRLRHENGQWSIKLTNSPIPITVCTSQEILTDELLQRRHPDFFDPLIWSMVPVGNIDEPMLTLRVCTWEKTGETSLGFAWLHVLGDATAEHQFLRALNHNYLGLERLPPPTFEKHLNPQPPPLERSLLQEVLPRLPHLAVDYAPEEFFKMHQNMMNTTARVDLQVSAEQLEALHAAAMVEAGIRISPGDAFGAYLTNLTNRVSPIPTRQIVNYIEYRGVAAVPGSDYAPPSSQSTGNIIFADFSDRMPPETFATIGSTAAFMRKRLKVVRTPEHVRRIIGLSDDLFRRRSETKRLEWYPYDDVIGLNNVCNIPFTDIHMGFPGKTKFIAFGDWERYFRMWPGNPTRRADGTWQSNKGSVRAMFRIKTELKEALLTAFQEDMAGLMRSKAKL